MFLLWDPRIGVQLKLLVPNCFSSWIVQFSTLFGSAHRCTAQIACCGFFVCVLNCAVFNTYGWYICDGRRGCCLSDPHIRVQLKLLVADVVILQIVQYSTLFGSAHPCTAKIACCGCFLVLHFFGSAHPFTTQIACCRSFSAPNMKHAEKLKFGRWFFSEKLKLSC